jgi:Tol biopolymer transport system component
MLRFIVETALDGRAAEIKESVIGVDVLGRSSGFDPKTDPIVRVEASRLRTRLDSYYQNEGHSDPVEIAIPKGAYLPVFTHRQSTATPAASRPGWLPLAVAFAAGVAALAIGVSLSDRPGPAQDALKLSLLPPIGAEVQYAAISPDGKKVAFASVHQGKQMLWVRGLDSLDAQPIPGSELSAFPFWSPDSQSLAFFGIDRLQRVELTGGPPQKISESRVTRGGAWGTGGYIVFAPAPRGGLFKVAAAGGTPEQVTRLDTARAEVAHHFPSFLPDGNHFVYLAVSTRPRDTSIRVGSLDGKTDKILTQANGSAQYAPASKGRTGYLMFGFDGALMAQPFDPKRLELSGGRVTVAPHVLHFRGRADFSISETGVLAYRAGTGKNLQLTWHNRDGKPLASVGDPNSFYWWALSPDEQRLAYQELSLSGGLTSIWTLDLARGAPSLIAEGYELFLPVWSPDSTEIAYTEGDDTKMVLRRRSVRGGTPVTILDKPGGRFPSDWSSDGRTVALATISQDGPWLDTFVVPADGSGPERMLASRDAPGRFAPAQPGLAPKHFAYVGVETGRPEIFVRSFPDGERKWRVSRDGGLQPTWRADGKELFFLALDGMLMSADISGDSELRIGTPNPLFQTGVRARRGIHDIWGQDYTPGRDGQRFLVNRRAGDGQTEPITIVIPWRP